MRRRNEWSKWIPASLISNSSSTVKSATKKDDHNKNGKGSPEGTTELPPPHRSSVDPLPLSADIVEDFMNDSTEQSEDKIQSSGETQNITSENCNSITGLGFQPSNGNDSTGHYNDDTEQCEDKVQSNGETQNVKSSTGLVSQPNNRNDSTEHRSESKCPAITQGADTVMSITVEDCESREIQVLQGFNVKNMDDSSNDTSDTFKLDEELELEHKNIRNDHPSTAGRYFRLLFA